MVLMNSKKSKGVTRIAVAGIAAAVISFTLTGVAENAVSGALQGKDIASGLKRLTVLSATLAMPIGNYDGNENNISKAINLFISELYIKINKIPGVCT